MVRQKLGAHVFELDTSAFNRLCNELAVAECGFGVLHEGLVFTHTVVVVLGLAAVSKRKGLFLAGELGNEGVHFLLDVILVFLENTAYFGRRRHSKCCRSCTIG